MSNIPQGCKPFNLQEALEGKPVVTRDGQLVKIGAYNPDATKTHRVVGWIEGNASSWYENGSYDNDEVHIRDLFMAPETMDVWVVLLSSIVSNVCTSSCIRYTEQDAKHLESLMMKQGQKSYGIHKITI